MRADPWALSSPSVSLPAADPWALSSQKVPEPVRPPSWLRYAREPVVNVTADDSVSQQGMPQVGPTDSVSQQGMPNVGPSDSVSQQCLAERGLTSWQNLPQPVQQPVAKEPPALHTLQVTGSAAVQQWKRQRAEEDLVSAVGMNDEMTLRSEEAVLDEPSSEASMRFQLWHYLGLTEMDPQLPVLEWTPCRFIG